MRLVRCVTSSVVGVHDDDDTDIVISDVDRQVSEPPTQSQRPELLAQIKARHVSQALQHRAPFNLDDSADVDRCDRGRESAGATVTRATRPPLGRFARLPTNVAGGCSDDGANGD